MDDSGAILCQITSLKDMLDQVNEEIEANIQITREIESEIVKCTEFEADLAARESDLTKTLYFSQFEINGLLSVAYESKKSVKFLEEEICGLRKRKMEMLESMDDKREQFVMQCLEFQRDIDKGENEVVNLLSEKEFLENEIHLLDEKNNALKNLMLAFTDEIVQDLLDCNSGRGSDLVKVWVLTSPMENKFRYTQKLICAVLDL
uniref:Uncharacterized protein n=1 Tax=Populus alba TaxID=43335 RepID=A0A4U5P3J1_POPAL|nr:uncharacterized protein D5086_0000234150 [Populus alba]